MNLLRDIYVSADIGGTNVRGMAYDAETETLGPSKRTPFKRSGEVEREVEENLCEPIDALLREMGYGTPKGIGVSTAALFNRQSGDIVVWPNNPVWDGFPLRTYLERRWACSIVLEDDANSAAWGEYLSCYREDHRNMAYIAIGTGIGCGLILNSALHIGTTGYAGEIGHIIVEQEGPVCSCGTKGCLQALSSGPGLVREFNKMNRLRNPNADDIHDFSQIVNLGRDSDGLANALFLKAGENIGWMIANLIMILDVSLIVIGGGVSKAGPILLEPIRRNVSLYLGRFDRMIEIQSSRLGDDSGTIGALNLAYEKVNNISIQSRISHRRFKK